MFALIAGFFWYWCYYPHRSPVCGIFHIVPQFSQSNSDISTRYCGIEFQCSGTIGANADVGTPDNTVCTNMKPFRISVHTDGVEYAHPIASSEHLAPNNAGFNLNYFMRTSCLWQKHTIA